MFGMGFHKRKGSTYPVPFAKRFADGGALRSIYEKPYGVRSNPLTDIRGNGGHFVLRSIGGPEPGVVIPGNTLTLDSVAGIASTVFFQGQALVPLYNANPNTLPTAG